MPLSLFNCNTFSLLLASFSLTLLKISRFRYFLILPKMFMIWWPCLCGLQAPFPFGLLSLLKVQEDWVKPSLKMNASYWSVLAQASRSMSIQDSSRRSERKSQVYFFWERAGTLLSYIIFLWKTQSKLIQIYSKVDQLIKAHRNKADPVNHFTIPIRIALELSMICYSFNILDSLINYRNPLLKYQIMEQQNPFQERDRKQHKGLSSKLKKKWEKQKKIMLQKKAKKQAYDKDKKKAEYYQKVKTKKNKDKKKDSYGVKVHKLKKAIMKFVKVYEDEIEDFYDIWKGLNEGGDIEIDDVENPDIKKCLKKMCKHLQLNRKDRVYSKPKYSPLNLESYMKRKVEEVMEDYLENGTNSEEEEDSEEHHIKPEDNATQAINAKPEIKTQVEQQQPASATPIGPTVLQVGPIGPPRPAELQQARQVQIGPFIPRDQRELIEKMFDETIHNQHKQAQHQERELDEIDRLFGYEPKKKEKPKQEDIPQQRYAKGSARLHYQTDPQQSARFLDQYNRKFRNKSLVEMHKEMLKAGQVEHKPNERKPFTRESLGSDKVDTKRLGQMLKGGVFFDFKDKMDKPTFL